MSDPNMQEDWGDVQTKLPGTGQDWETPPEGNIPATICALFDVGHHLATNDTGGTYDKPILIIGFELSEHKKDGEPFYLAKPYTLALKHAGGKASASALLKLVKMLDHEPEVGERFTPRWLAGKPCMVQVVHKLSQKGNYTNTWANIASVSALPKALTVPNGGCSVWRVQDRERMDLPPVAAFLPPMYHEGTGKALTVSEWVRESNEVSGTPGKAADVRHAQSARKNGEAATANATTTDEDIPF